MTTSNTTPITDLGTALSSSIRVEILLAATLSPRPVGALAEEVGITQSTASYHIAALLRAGLISVREDGARHIVEGCYREIRVALVS
jgi:DNA-binding transcriptional ArsR family regulator